MGSGLKTFLPGTPLPAADVNGYLMQQVVITCTSATRPASPVTGMPIYETDTGREYRWNGTFWCPVSGMYAGAGNAWTASTSNTNVGGATVTIPAGNWLIQACMNWNISTGGSSTYSALLLDTTTSTQIAFGQNVSPIANGGVAVPLIAPLAITAPHTIQLQAGVGVVSGVQILSQPTWIVAIPQTALN